jgi:hypothetical protein
VSGADQRSSATRSSAHGVESIRNARPVARHSTRQASSRRDTAATLKIKDSSATTVTPLQTDWERNECSQLLPVVITCFRAPTSASGLLTTEPPDGFKERMELGLRLSLSHGSKSELMLRSPEWHSSVLTVVAVVSLTFFHVDHWTGDSTSTTGAASFTVSRPKAVTAEWRVDNTMPYALWQFRR